MKPSDLERSDATARVAGEMSDGAPCPFCGLTDTRLLSPFGGQLSVAQYWCRRCRTGFDYMKWEDAPAPAD